VIPIAPALHLLAHEFRSKAGVAGTVEYGLFVNESAAVAGVTGAKVSCQ
jgi:hypothetical protein